MAAKRFRLPSVNGNPMVEFQYDMSTGEVFRRALLPDGSEFLDGGSDWAQLSGNDLLHHFKFRTPVANWLGHYGVNPIQIAMGMS